VLRFTNLACHSAERISFRLQQGSKLWLLLQPTAAFLRDSMLS
jgi:hypothetical protein